MSVHVFVFRSHSFLWTDLGCAICSAYTLDRTRLDLGLPPLPSTSARRTESTRDNRALWLLGLWTPGWERDEPLSVMYLPTLVTHWAACHTTFRPIWGYGALDASVGQDSPHCLIWSRS